MGQIWDGSEEIFLKMRIAPPPATAARHHISVSFRDADGALIGNAVEGARAEKNTAKRRFTITSSPLIHVSVQNDPKKITVFLIFQLCMLFTKQICNSMPANQSNDGAKGKKLQAPGPDHIFKLVLNQIAISFSFDSAPLGSPLPHWKLHSTRAPLSPSSNKCRRGGRF